jgi:hypothetical protein
MIFAMRSFTAKPYRVIFEGKSFFFMGSLHKKDVYFQILVDSSVFCEKGQCLK